jgi:hypothetical protein
MPRGNDAEAAAAEFAAKVGEHANAEDLITAHRASIDRDVARASLAPIDQGATDALDLEALKVAKGERVIAAAVRGGIVIGVVEDENGTVLPKRKFDIPADARKASTLQQQTGGPKRAGEPPVSAEEQAERMRTAKAEADEAAAAAQMSAQAAEEKARVAAAEQAAAKAAGEADEDTVRISAEDAEAEKAQAEQGTPKTAK